MVGKKIREISLNELVKLKISWCFYGNF